MSAVKGFGVTTLELEHFFISNGSTMESQFVGVFPADEKEKNFLKFSENMKQKKAKYPFMIANTDPAAKSGTHWWSFLDTEQKDTLFLFDSLGSYRILNFIVQNDLEVFNKLIPGQFNQIFKKDNKITLLRWSFKLDKFEKLKDRDINKLSDTAKHFFRFLYEFGKQKGVKNTVKVVTVDDNMQSLDTDYCGPFQMYFYLNLFEPLETSVVARSTSKKLTVNLIGELLNEIFVIKTKHNERMLDSFILQNDIEFAESSDSEMDKDNPDT